MLFNAKIKWITKRSPERAYLMNTYEQLSRNIEDIPDKNPLMGGRGPHQ